MISLHSVSKRFGMKLAVSDVSFETKPGEVIGFVGPNGAGKTTTMRLIVGLLYPTHGSVRIFDVNPISNRMSVLSRLGFTDSQLQVVHSESTHTARQHQTVPAGSPDDGGKSAFWTQHTYFPC